MPPASKIFCVGLPKTGLTSLLKLMKELGFISRGRAKGILFKAFHRGDFDTILSHYDTAEFFCDVPTPQMLKLIYEKYGNKAKYILTTRQSAEIWVSSLKRHQIYSHPIRNKHHWIFGRYYAHGFEKEHIDYYVRHNAAVRAFFADRGALDSFLELRLDDADAVPRLLAFLGVKSDIAAFPRCNVSGTKTETISDRFKRRYNTLVQPLYGAVAPMILPAQPKRVFFWEVEGKVAPEKTPRKETVG